MSAESIAVSRKKALLRVLAVREAERLAIAPSDGDLASFAAEFRDAFALAGDAELEAWLARAAMSRTRFAALLRELWLLQRVERAFEAQIEAELADQCALFSAHAWADQARGRAP